VPHKPRQIEFAKLNIAHTVMGKRYLRYLVERSLVDGWDDPRMPTLCALRRRGYTPSSITEFIRVSGVSRTNSLSDIALLEHCVRDELNAGAIRRIAVLEPLKLVVTNYPEDREEYFELPNNPNDPAAGTRKARFSRELYIERSDYSDTADPKFFRLKPGGEVRLMGAYIVKFQAAVTGADGEVIEVHCTADLQTANGMPADGRKVKGTIHWLSAGGCKDISAKLYDNLLTFQSMNDMPEDGKLDDYINPESCKYLRHCKAEADVTGGVRYQFVRNGYFWEDSREPGAYIRIVGLKDGYKAK